MRKLRTILLTIFVIIILLIAVILLLNDLSGNIPSVVYTSGIS